MATTYEIINETTLTTTAASITFSSIPQTFTDLKIVISGRSDWANAINTDGILVRPNGSSSNMTSIRLYGSGSSAASDTNAGQLVLTNASATANTFGNSEIYIPNYTSSNNKSMSIDAVSETNATTAYASLGTLLWSNSSAITSLDLLPQNGPNFVSGSSFYLYGISNA
jgi:hypothetical protein